MYAIGMTSGYVRYACPCARFKTLFIYQSALADVQKLLNQHKYPTHCSSACSTLIAQILSQRGKRTLYWFIDQYLCLLVVHHMVKTLNWIVQCWIWKVYCEISQTSVGAWSRFVLGRKQRAEGEVYQCSTVQFSDFSVCTHFVSSFQTRIRRRRCPGSTILLCSCAIVAKKNNKKCKRFPSPQHNLLQYWEKIVETKQ